MDRETKLDIIELVRGYLGVIVLTLFYLWQFGIIWN